MSDPDQKNHYAPTVTDYINIFREKIWYFIVIFIVIASAAVVYCFKATPFYDATSMIQVIRDDPNLLDTRSVESSEIKSLQDLNTQVKIIESDKILERVAESVRNDFYNEFMAPLQGPKYQQKTIEQIIKKDRKINSIRASLMVEITYSHPDAEVASKIANLFADYYIDYKVRLDSRNSMKAVDDLRDRVEEQRVKVEKIERSMSAYRETNKSVSLESHADIDHQELSALNSMVAESANTLDQARARWDLLKEYRKSGLDISVLPFISEMEHVKALSMQHSIKKIEISALSQRYGKKHPTMIKGNKALEETKKELEYALTIASKQIENNYVNQRQNYQNALARLKGKEKQIHGLNKIRVEYNSLSRDLEVNQALYQSLVLRMNTELAQVSLSKPNARIIDIAGVPPFPARPKPVLVVAGGMVSGLFFGFSAVLVAAYFDDKIKTAFDIETLLGIPLAGVIPRLKGFSSPEKAFSVVSNVNSQVTEAFRAIHSGLRLNEVGKNAQVIVATSTVPSEGKTFFCTNLASTFASHDQKCLVIDADLRVPAFQKLFTSEKAQAGILQYFEGEASFEKVISHDEKANVDYIIAGGKSTNPTKILASDQFGELIREARQKYDKIIIDTPPLGVVSDALTALPHADGLIYIIKFDSISRSSVKRNVARVEESGVPIIGAVVNQVNVRFSDYYYNTYYSKAYSKYYS